MIYEFIHIFILSPNYSIANAAQGPNARTLLAAAYLVSGMGAVRAAQNIDGTPAAEPVDEDDPSLIADPTAYLPDQHDCPLSCVDYANTHSWSPVLLC